MDRLPTRSGGELVRAAGWSVVLALSTAGLAGAQAARASNPPHKWTLVWSEEFAGPAGRGIDTSRWQYDVGDGCRSGNCGWGNQEKEYYASSSENVALDGRGHLMIIARPAPPGLTCYYGPCRYTSGKITTRGKVEAAPGRVEARIRLSAGQGLWPAFWMLGANFPTTPWPECGELDIMENHGSRMQSTSSAIHGPGYFGQTPFVHGVTLGHGSFADDFHTFAVVWDSASVRFLVDDSVHYTVARHDVARYGRWVFDQPFFIILNLAVGGTFDGDPTSDSMLPATMLIDYVRVYRPSPPGT